MSINSPVSNFIDVLKQVINTAQNFGAKLTINEAATRAALIDPVLKSLGWDPTQPDMIELEKSYNSTRLDYALLDCTGKVIAIIEAKSLGSDLTKPAVVSQILSYGFTYSILNIILTDGIAWHHYFLTSAGNITPKIINLNKDELTTCAYFFLDKLDASQFWLTASSSTSSVPVAPITPVTAVNPMLAANSKGQQPLQFQSLTSLPKDLRNVRTPQSLSLPDGTVIPIHHWRDILSECITFVLKTNPSIQIPLKDKAGKHMSLIDYSKINMKGTVIQTTYNGKTVYIGLNYDSRNCVANAIYILGLLPSGQNWQPVEVA